MNAAQCLDDWQKAGDPRLWKIIISPEFGEQLNLPELARGVMAEVEKELGSKLQWAAVAHYNTGHPHVHIAMRGIDQQGREVRLAKDFVQRGIRQIAEDCCTKALGYRTRAQALEAQRREGSQMRYTSLDRILMRANAAVVQGTHFPVTCQGGGRAQFVVGRLAILEGMGLARRISPDSWEVRCDFHSVLRGMQKLADRQKTLSAGGVLRSDERLPIVPLDHRAMDRVEGRILVHGEEENGRSYMMLEATDAKVYTIYHTRQMQEMRKVGGLRVNTFIRLRRVFADGRPRTELEELGSSNSILENKDYLKETAQQLALKGIAPVNERWGGWLGRYQQALTRAAEDLRAERESHSRSR